MKKLIAGISALVIAGGCVCGYFFFWRSSKEDTDVISKEVTVQRGNVTAGVTESAAVKVESLEQTYDLVLNSTSITASVESSGSASLSGGSSKGGMSAPEGMMNTSSGSRSSGSTGSTSVSSKLESTALELVVDKVNVTEGQTVKQGDVLMTLTKDSIDKARDLLKNAVTDAELALKQAQIDESKTKLSAKYEYDTRIAEGKNAQSVYNSTLNKIAQNISDLSSQISDVNSQIASCSDDKQLSQLKNQLESLKSQLSSAQSSRAADELAAKQKYEETCMYYKNAQDLYNVAVSGVGTASEQAQETVKTAKSDLEAFEKYVKDGNILAQHSGTVTGVGYSSGDTLNSETAIASFADAESITVTVNVTEDDISVVNLNDKVDVSFLSYKDEVYSGYVSEIGSAASNSKSTTVSYPVTVVITKTPDKILSGMTANVTFVSKKVENVLYVSNKAVTNEGSQSYVLRKKEDGGEEKIKIDAGFSNGNITEISGVSEGDTLIIKGKVS